MDTDVLVEIFGESGFSIGSHTTLSVDSISFVNIEWSTGENTGSITASVPGPITVRVEDQNSCIQEGEIIIAELPRDTFVINRFTCDPLEVTSIDSIEFEDNCEILYLIDVQLSPDVDCFEPVEPTANNVYVPNVIDLSSSENSEFRILGPDIANIESFNTVSYTHLTLPTTPYV